MAYSALNPDSLAPICSFDIHWQLFWKTVQLSHISNFYWNIDVIPTYHLLKGSAANEKQWRSYAQAHPGQVLASEISYCKFPLLIIDLP